MNAATHSLPTAAKADTVGQSKATDKLLLALQVFQDLDSEFPLQYAICLLEISQNEGLSLTQLADQTGMALSTISRIVGALSDHRQSGEPFGLVDVTISAQERRKKEVILTEKGRNIVEILRLTLDSE